RKEMNPFEHSQMEKLMLNIPTYFIKGVIAIRYFVLWCYEEFFLCCYDLWELIQIPFIEMFAILFFWVGSSNHDKDDQPDTDTNETDDSDDDHASISGHNRSRDNKEGWSGPLHHRDHTAGKGKHTQKNTKCYHFFFNLFEFYDFQIKFLYFYKHSELNLIFQGISYHLHYYIFLMSAFKQEHVTKKKGLEIVILIFFLRTTDICKTCQHAITILFYNNTPNTPTETEEDDMSTADTYVQIFLVQVEVIKATSLEKADTFGLSDPYCRV
ncbi:hypothetical protein RFI_19574, partial [Reticulomyxa filosa]